MDGRAGAPECPELEKSMLVSAWVDVEDGRGEAVQSVISKWSPAGIEAHGIIPGCDTLRGGGSFSLCSRGPGHNDGLNAGAAGPGFFISTGNGCFSAESREPLCAGLHHLAGVYDGRKIRVYVDGRRAAEKPASGKILNSDAPVTVGCFRGGGGRFRGRVIDSFIRARPLTGTEIGGLARGYRIREEKDSSLRIELDTYQALDFRSSIAGRVYTGGGPGERVRVSAASRLDGEIRWQETFPCPDARRNYAFEIPVKKLPGGYYILEAEDSAGSTSGADFVVREDFKERKKPATDYLQYVLSAVQAILAGQSRPLFDAPGGVPFVTVSRKTCRARRAIGYRLGSGYQSGFWPEEPFEYRAFRMDHEIWPVLDELSRLTGDGQYAKMADKAAGAFIEHGFDAESGLIYIGESCSFDVSTARPRHAKRDSTLPGFKSINTGLSFDMHVPRFWEKSPEKTLRWLKAVFYGLVADPDSMDYNRYCPFGFDDSLREPALSRNCAHCAFDTAGANMIYFWSFCWARAGDRECLGWAHKMASKWKAAQDKKSGLVPNFFGAVPEGEYDCQPPGSWCKVASAALTSLQWLRAAEILRERPGAEALRNLLLGMGNNLSEGIAGHAYDPVRKIFMNELCLDGSELKETGRYCFKTEEEKQEAVKVNPELENVDVSWGTDLFMGSRISFALSEAALIRGNRALEEKLDVLTEGALQEALKHSGPFTEEYAWTFPSSGYAVLACVNLFRLSGERDYLARAKTLADREIRALGGIKNPDWRRVFERNVWLYALLQLHSEQENL